ncbi:hypothetical protein HY501_01720 [Candidatus Woesearchaeota archaeon]|nr:hypothetical protein [Candidatus Woesearchaeota archaeon]
MRQFRKKTQAFIAAAIAAGSFTLGAYMRIRYDKPDMQTLNSLYCSSPLAKELKEPVGVSLSIVVEESLEDKLAEIQEAFETTKHLYKEEFNIHLDEEFIVVPEIKEFSRYGELKLSIPEDSREKDTYIFIAEHLDTINKDGSFIGMMYGNAIIAIHNIEEMAAIDISVILSHEMGHLFYAEHLEEGFQHCIMYIKPMENANMHRLSEMCPESKATIIRYRDRIW